LCYHPESTNISIRILYAYTILYIILGVVLFVKHRENLRDLLGRTVSNAHEAMGTSDR
jgi:cation:H+ antiporter